ncbi:N-acetyltransferase family protein [Variovorax sp. M-6]|uniref:GNAT family N-acetyltransferase n=1 Tax=Variovorax sp. M-6 TaxID=3233041 RepID=UPI003F99AF19
MQDPADLPPPPALPATLPLRDGRRVTVREILPEDKEALQAAIGHMSTDSRYTRFMGTVRDLPDTMLEAATHPVPEREFALVAVAAEGSGESIIGGARYASAAGSDTCEFAIAIVDGWQGQGLAPRLMETLVAAAEAHGFRCMEGYVLSTNAPMRGLAKRLGFQESQVPGDATVRMVRRVLGQGHEAAPG